MKHLTRFLTRRFSRYDALTRDNKISYQNGLNDKNIHFSTACGAVLTNYCWKESDVLASKSVASNHGLPFDKVYFGIDVWAQNTVNFGLPRTTYPELRGGGTNTGVAVKKLANMGLSAGVFAPAWSFEHFPGYGQDAERAVWEGNALWDGATCTCRGEASFCHPHNPDEPIVESAKQFPAGSDRFFYTDFGRAFAAHEDKEARRLYSGKRIHSQLGSQSILPNLATTRVQNGSMSTLLAVSRFMVERHEGRLRPLLSVSAASHDQDTTCKEKIPECDLPLFKLNMPADGSLRLSMRCDCRLASSLYLRFSSGIKLVPIEGTNHERYLQFTCAVAPEQISDANVRLQELGVRIHSRDLRQSMDCDLRIYQICIVPYASLDLKRSYSMENVQIEKRRGDNHHWRLRWSYRSSIGDDERSVLTTPAIPYSQTTGPFSYFSIQIDGVDLGRAYALEHVLPEQFIESFEGSFRVVLVGVGFDGEEIARFEQEKMLPPA